MSFNTARIQRPYNGSKKTDVKLSLQRILENLPAGQEVTKIVPIYFRAKRQTLCWVILQKQEICWIGNQYINSKI